jgi:hypothetical protein
LDPILTGNVTLIIAGNRINLGSKCIPLNMNTQSIVIDLLDDECPSRQSTAGCENVGGKSFATSSIATGQLVSKIEPTMTEVSTSSGNYLKPSFGIMMMLAIAVQFFCF